jgi:hypothetical protein
MQGVQPKQGGMERNVSKQQRVKTPWVDNSIIT